MFSKNSLSGYLSFTRRDRIGALALLVLIAMAYALPLLFPRRADFPLQASPLLAAADTLDQHAVEPRHNYSFSNTGHAPVRLFRFDPNTIDAEGWQLLGLRDKTIGTLLKYRSKGGRFRRPEDLQKIWGLPPGFYERVKDSIVIEKENETFPQRLSFPSTPYKRSFTIEPVDINRADTAALIALPGIGSKLAARIATFRDKLGGFYSIDQLRETYGLSDSTFQKIRTFLRISGAPRKFPLNTVTRDELKQHPYFHWPLANAIITYRTQHGNFTSLEELKNIALVNDEVFGKIAPYLQVN